MTHKASTLMSSAHPSERVEPHDYMEVVFGGILLVIVCLFMTRLFGERE